MLVSLEVSGGFFAAPALNQAQTIDTQECEPERGDEIEQLIHEVRFFSLPTQLSQTKPEAADHFTYRLTVKDGTYVHSVEVSDPVPQGEISRLINILRSTP